MGVVVIAMLAPFCCQDTTSKHGRPKCVFSAHAWELGDDFRRIEHFGFARDRKIVRNYLAEFCLFSFYLPALK